MEDEQELEYLCCFCGRGTPTPVLVGIVMDWSDDSDENDKNAQYFFAHPACIVDLMVPEARRELFGNDSEEDEMQTQ